MDREKLKERILKVRGWNVGEFGETQAKTSIIQPIFDCLGWDSSDPGEVFYEYPLSPEGRVDYAFLKGTQPVIFVEAKAPNKPLDSYTPQLLKYAFAKGVQLAVLTNGVEWWLYLPMQGGEWDDRKFYSVDLRKQDVEEICDRLAEFLSKEDVLSGRALQNATEMRKSAERETKVRQTLPEVWRAVISEPNEALVDLLIEETERACGHRPDEITVTSFLAKQVPPTLVPPTVDVDDSRDRGSGLLIYAPEINSRTFLHFSWLGESCALRDYSRPSTRPPKADRRYQTSHVRAKIKNQVQGDGRNRKHVDYWHQMTVEANKSIAPTNSHGA
jgi:predicted type IV restriction endonuclease